MPPPSCRLGLLLLVAGACALSHPTGSGTSASGTTSYRLPKYVVPDTYVLRIVPYLESSNFSFEGTVEITVEAVKAVDTITLHAHQNLTVLVTSFSQVGSDSNLTVSQSRTLETQFLTLTLDEKLVVGERYVIKAAFSGALRKDLYGLYLSSYTTEDGVTKYMATTHFEATYARKAFPCFDEPEYRANFSISLAKLENQTALSNMPVKSTSSQPDSSIGNRYWVTFEETPKMPTYLVAYIVGELQEIATDSDYINVYVREGVEEQAALVRDLAPKVIAYLANYTNIPYMLPKLDLVAVPDFPIGAMENWGLVTFRERRMLYSNASKTDKAFAVATIVTHELAHLWFGDYVTVEWWGSGWIKEGLAEMLMYYVLDEVTDDEYDAVPRLAVEETQDAFGADGLTVAIPLTNEAVESPSQIEIQMDGLTYSKGASLYQMLLKVMGDSMFREGLQRFLVENAYSTSDPTKLATALQEAVDAGGGLSYSIQIKDFIESWTLGPGYPVVTAIRDYNNNTATLSQERFLWYPIDASSSYYNVSDWIIPFSVSNEANLSQFDDIIEDATPKKISLSQIPSNSFYVLNWGQNGYYRVNYDLVNWNRLCASLREGSAIDAAQSAALIDDAFALAHVGLLEQFYSLQVLELAAERWPTELVPWSAIRRNLWRVHALVRSSGEYDKAFTLYMREHILKKAYASIGWEASALDSRSTRAARDIVTQLACQFGVPACKKRAVQTYLDYQSDLSNVNADILAATLCEALSDFNLDELVPEMYELYQSEADLSRRTAFVFGFGCIPDEDVLYDLMDTIVQNTTTIYGEVTTFFRSITAHHPAASELVSNYVSDYVDVIDDILGDDVTLQILWDLAATASDEDKLLKIENTVLFLDYDSNELGNLTDVAAYNLQWVRESLPELMDYVNMQMGSLPPTSLPEAVPTSESATTPSPVPSVPSPTDAPTNITSAEDEWYLPGDVLPESYVLSVVPYIQGKDNSTYSGTVDILVKAINATDAIVLHAGSSLNVSVLAVTENSTQTTVAVAGVDRNATTEFLSIRLGSSLEAGLMYNVSIAFNGTLLEDNEGFYLSTYTVGNETKFMATTFMAPTLARKAFPCFDEPRYRATFQITVAREQSQTALSNMPLNRTSEADSSIGGRVRDTFASTPPMATYLVAFIVSELKDVNTSDSRIKIYVREGAEESVSFAANLAPVVLSALEEYTGFEYALSKLDLVAVPDFKTAAMANWGLVTFREYRLLLSAESSTLSQLSVAEEIAHQLTHLWLGDLVTVAQWSYAWLQEGAASLLERVILDKATGERYHAMHWLGVERVERAMEADALLSTDTLTNLTIGSPESIIEHLGIITNSKGAGFLNMLMKTYGDDIFREGLHILLANNSYGWATPADFSSALQEAVDQNGTASYSLSVRDVVNSWTLQPGYPVITAVLDYDSAQGVTVTQSRFFAQNVSDSSTVGWNLPYQYIVQGARSALRFSGILSDSSSATDLSTGLLTSSSFVLFNPDVAGFYRVNYDVHNWLRLSDALAAGSFRDPPLRASLIADAFALSLSGLLDPWVPLLLVQSVLPYDASPVVWTAARKGLFLCAARARADNETAFVFQVYLEEVLTDGPFSLVALRNQWNVEESFETKCARDVLSQMACEAQNVVCTSIVQDHFKQWLSNSSVLGDPDLLPATLCVGVAKGESSDFHSVLQAVEAFTHETDRSVRLAFAYGLGCTQDSDKRETLMEAATTEDYFESQEIESLFTSIVDHSDTGVEDVLTFVYDKFDNIIDKKGLKMATRILQLLAERVYSTSQFNKIADVASSHPCIETRVAASTASLSLRWANRSAAVFKEAMAAAAGLQLVPLPTPAPSASSTSTATTTTATASTRVTSTSTHSSTTTTTTAAPSPAAPSTVAASVLVPLATMLLLLLP